MEFKMTQLTKKEIFNRWKNEQEERVRDAYVDPLTNKVKKLLQLYFVKTTMLIRSKKTWSNV